jgi:acetyl-CoA carboxylase biotin carboxyl carrier protein
MKRRGARPAPDEPTVVELIRQLGGLLGELGLAELEVTIGDTHVRLARPAPGASLAALPSADPATTPAGAREFSAVATPPGAVTVEAPMVGTFYRAASPTGEPYVRAGDVVKEGQILCIIEAMKLMNEIEAKAAGRIVTIFAENAQAVEYGQPLFLIEPTL